MTQLTAWKVKCTEYLLVNQLTGAIDSAAHEAVHATVTPDSGTRGVPVRYPSTHTTPSNHCMFSRAFSSTATGSAASRTMVLGTVHFIVPRVQLYFQEISWVSPPTSCVRMATLFSLPASKLIDGSMLDMASLAGKPALAMNVASR